MSLSQPSYWTLSRTLLLDGERVDPDNQSSIVLRERNAR